MAPPRALQRASSGRRGGRHRRRGTNRKRVPIRDWLRNPVVVVSLAVASLLLVAVTVWMWDGGETAEEPAATQSADTLAPEHDQSSPPPDPPRPMHAIDGRPPPQLLDEATVATIGEPVDAGTFVITVTDARVEEGAGGRDHLLVFLTLTNDTDSTQPHELDAFSLIAERGAVVQPAPSRRDDAIAAGAVEPAAEVSGTLGFPTGPGTHTLIYETSDQLRFIWILEA